jgi:hypothetical protein
LKLKRIQIQNIGPIEDVNIKVEKSLNLFIGQPCAGKSTLLHAFTWGSGGVFPTDIIRHGCTEALIEFEFDSALIRREFYRAGDGTTKARALTFIQDGKPVPRPFEAVQKLLNPYQLNQRHFLNMKDKDKIAYLLEILGVDTSETDALIAMTEEKASVVRKELARIGEPAFVAVVEQPDDLTALQAERKRQVGEWQTAVHAKAIRQREIEEAQRKRKSIQEEALIFQGGIHNVQEAMKLASTEAEVGAQATLETWFDEATTKLGNEACAKIDELNRQIQAIEEQHQRDREVLRGTFAKDREETQKRFAAARESHAKEIATNAEQLGASEKALVELVIPEALPEPVLDVSEIDARIAKAQADAVAYARYLDYVKVRDQRQATKSKLKAEEAELARLRDNKRGLLAQIAESSPIKDLSFSEDGEPMYRGTTLEMLSDSQGMELTSALAALYPQGIGVELIDRGESLGKRIFEFVDYAQKHNRTVLATIVGDAPATVPDDVGVFVVENGKVNG